MRAVNGILVVVALAGGVAGAAQTPFEARVRVTERVVNKVRAGIFGDNIEWVHHGMGIRDPAVGRFDEGLVAELKAAGVTHLRYPGGTLSDFFDWSAAVGTNRQPQPNPFDKGRTEYPDFGPDEFAALCRKLGIPATITVSAGRGSPELAGAWAAHLRRSGVRVAAFEVGNEIYMADAAKEEVPDLPIAHTADQYVAFYLRARAAILSAWPGARVGGIGLVDTGAFPLNRHPDWMEKLLRGAGDQLDFVAIHNGYAPAATFTWASGKQERQPDEEVARSLLAASEYVRRNIEATLTVIGRFAPGGGRRIDLQITEYGPLVYPLDPAHGVEDMRWNRSLAGALYQACLFNVMLREPRIAAGNHLPLIQDGFGALIGVRGAGAARKRWRNIVFHVFRLYAAQVGRQVVRTIVDAPAFACRQTGIVPALRDVPLIDAAAFRAADRRSSRIFLVNRDLVRPAALRLEPGAGPYRVASITTLAGDSLLAENGPEHPDAVRPVRRAGPAARRVGALPLTLLPHSLTVVELAR